MIAGGLERLGSPRTPLAGVMNLGHLAVHELLGVNDFAAESLADALVPEANPEDRDLAGESADERHRDTGLVGRRGPREITM